MTTDLSQPLPPAERGDATPDRIYREVGHALSEWECVEDVLADFFALFVGAESHEGTPAKRAYGTISAFRGRKNMLAAAAAGYFDERPSSDLRAEFDALLKRCDNLSARRNELAHGQARKGSVNIPQIGEFHDPTWYLMPAYYNLNKSLKSLGFSTDFGDPEKAQADALAFLRTLQREGFGKYKYNADQITQIREGFSVLENEAFSLLERVRKS